MTDQQSFEVYPPAAGSAPAESTPPAAGPVWEQGQPEPAPPGAGYPITARQAPPDLPPRPAGPGPSRRGLFIGGIAALAVGIGLLNASRNQARDDGVDRGSGSGDSDSTDNTDNTDVAGLLEVGSFFAELPEGWDQEDVGDEEVVATHGANRVQAYSFFVDSSDQPAALVTALTRRRLGAFKGTLGAPGESSDEDVRRAVVRSEGTLSGKPARVISQLWIDVADQALLVVRVLTAKAGSTIDKQASTIVDELSWGF